MYCTSYARHFRNSLYQPIIPDDKPYKSNFEWCFPAYPVMFEVVACLKT